MTTSCCCNCFCLSKRQAPEEEPNAFDLTWRNYLLPSCVPSIFKRQQPIRLEDDDDLFITPNQGRAVRGYLDDPNDWEFDSMLVNQEFPEFVTRNPFGKTKKKRKHKKHHRQQRALPEDEEIFSEEIQDAEFLGDDQIAHLAYERRKDMDPYGEEGYIENYDRPLSQEMQPPPQKEFYAARAMPYYLVDEDQEYLEQQDEQPEASSSTAVVAEQAQGLLSERLDDLTDKLVYIRQNIMDINRQDEPDTATLKTINKADADKAASDMDSIASEALDEYERPGDEDGRRRSGASQYRFPFGGGDSPPFGSDHHPFSYFTDQNASSPPTSDNDNNTPGLNLRGVLDFGKRWLGA